MFQVSALTGMLSEGVCMYMHLLSFCNIYRSCQGAQHDLQKRSAPVLQTCSHVLDLLAHLMLLPADRLHAGCMIA